MLRRVHRKVVSLKIKKISRFHHSVSQTKSPWWLHVTLNLRISAPLSNKRPSYRPKCEISAPSSKHPLSCPHFVDEVMGQQRMYSFRRVVLEWYIVSGCKHAEHVKL